jgi:hypothetical protein
VRKRAALGGRDDRREARPVGAAPAHLVLQLERHLALDPPREPALAQPPVDLVGQRRGGADALDLLRLLDGALGLHEPAGAHELDPLGHDRPQPRVGLDGDVVVLEAEPQPALRPAVRERCHEVLRPLLAVEPVDLRRRLLDVAEVGDEAAHVAADDRHPVRAGEARQVAQVREVCDQQEVQLALVEPRGDTVGAGRHGSASFRRASASR